MFDAIDVGHYVKSFAAIVRRSEAVVQTYVLLHTVIPNNRGRTSISKCVLSDNYLHWEATDFQSHRLSVNQTTERPKLDL